MTKTERKQFIFQLAHLGRQILSKEDMCMSGTIEREKINTYEECTKNGISLKYQLFESMIDSEVKLENKAYVYDGASLAGLTFKEFDTIADAVRFALSTSESKVLVKGNVIEYNRYNDESAYYIDEQNKKMMIISL